MSITIFKGFSLIFPLMSSAQPRLSKFIHIMRKLTILYTQFICTGSPFQSAIFFFVLSSTPFLDCCWWISGCHSYCYYLFDQFVNFWGWVLWSCSIQPHCQIVLFCSLFGWSASLFLWRDHPNKYFPLYKKVSPSITLWWIKIYYKLF